MLANCIRFEKGAYDILYGCDEQFIGALAMGCQVSWYIMWYETPALAVPWDVVSKSIRLRIRRLSCTLQGAVGSTYNYLGRAGNGIIEAWGRGDHAAALAEQAKIQVRVRLGPHPVVFFLSVANT